MIFRRGNSGCYLVLILLFGFSAELCAKKRDFRGLFGNYRRDKFIENEGNASDFGINAMLSTLLPMSSVVSSSGGTASLPEGSLHYATFFNVEIGVFVTLAYNFEVYGRIGYYNYDTRRENTVSGTNDVQFHEFRMLVIPLTGGIKYRFSRGDIVPYIGVGAGLSYVERRGSYDFAPLVNDAQFLQVLTGEVLFGFEFFFGSNAGIRLELGGYYLNLPARTFNSGASSIPILNYKANPFFIRYASGLFVLL